MLECAEGTVKSRCSRGRERLAELLRDRLADPPHRAEPDPPTARPITGPARSQSRRRRRCPVSDRPDAPSSDDETPEIAEIRRLLADARHVDPMPEDVVARMSRALDRLADEPHRSPARVPCHERDRDRASPTPTRGRPPRGGGRDRGRRRGLPERAPVLRRRQRHDRGAGRRRPGAVRQRAGGQLDRTLRARLGRRPLADDSGEDPSPSVRVRRASRHDSTSPRQRSASSSTTPTRCPAARRSRRTRVPCPRRTSAPMPPWSSDVLEGVRRWSSSSSAARPSRSGAPRCRCPDGHIAGRIRSPLGRAPRCLLTRESRSPTMRCTHCKAKRSISPAGGST